MNKYKIVGVFNLLSGFFQVLFSLLMLFIVLPRVLEMYSELNLEEVSSNFAYVTIGLLLLMGLLNVYVALKLFSERVDREKHLRIGIILLSLTIITLGISVGFSVLSVIEPLYSVSSTL